jgi:LytS/YehU family sensor histidine kinase
MTSRRRLLPLLIFLLFTAIGLLLFSYRYLDDLAGHRYGTLAQRFIEEMTGVYASLPIVPIARYVGRRFSWCRATWPTALAANLAALVVYSALHTTLMALSRAVIYPLAGLGAYDYGDMVLRYPMEASNDAVFYAIAAGFVFFIRREARARHAELEAAELRGRLAQAKLENLRLQLQPHFLFNALNAISALMYEDVGRADAMLARLSEFLRTVLAASDVQQVSIADELDVERMYLDVMRARLERGLQFDVRVDPAAAGALVPFLVLQPLLENAIRHGMAGERDAIAIAVDVLRDGDATIISVADDGVGPPPEGGRRGVGLANVESRLRALFGDGNTSCALSPGSGGGSRVTLRFPYSPAVAGAAP